jgi:hypothetical protein
MVRSTLKRTVRLYRSIGLKRVALTITKPRRRHAGDVNRWLTLTGPCIRYSGPQ